MPALYTERLELVPATPAMLRAAIDAGRDSRTKSSAGCSRMRSPNPAGVIRFERLAR